MVEDRSRSLDHAFSAIFALAADGHERFSDIVGRLGQDHKLVRAWARASERHRDVVVECRCRYGPSAVTFDSMWVTFLRTVRR